MEGLGCPARHFPVCGDSHIISFSFSYLFTLVDDELAALETITLQEGAFSHVSTLEIDSLPSLRSLHLEGENLVDISLLHLHCVNTDFLSL